MGDARQAMHSMIPTRAAAAIVALAAWLATAALLTPAPAAPPRPPAPAVTCTNPASGATWQITIDYDRATVDANPVQISAGEISWHDPTDGASYTLDRRSGALTAVLASSTGGYFLHDHCRLPP
jgi:hypothetical protein